jgi:hypothetical protein
MKKQKVHALHDVAITELICDGWLVYIYIYIYIFV